MPSSSAATPPGNPRDPTSHENKLREANQALIAMSVRQHEFIEETGRARQQAEELAAELLSAEARLRGLKDSFQVE